ncbi:MAG: IPExxxVDY family protein [Bacteroidetes bacterium]|nr:IPExxxVDY family protein [Bacteroidota bacterium]MBS1929877.1 IPExxxVDY family protein [Bacteroidota bacterium]
MAERSTKLLLDNDEMIREFFEDTRLLGIVAPIKDYQFCWHLNNNMTMDFRVNNDIEIQLTRKKRNYFFAVYEYNEPTGSLAHYIYNNRFDGEYLLPEFRHLDFFWLMKGDAVTASETLQQKIDSVKTINGVQLVVELTNEKIRNKEHLIF